MLNKRFFLIASSLVALASCGGGKKVSSSAYDDASSSAFARAVQDRVFFGFDKSDLSSESKAVLAKQAEWIKAHGAAHYKVEGHCDERGTREYNLALGERRANSAKKYLVSQGVAASQLEVVSFGKEKPAVYGHDEQAWAQNRRAVTSVAEAAAHEANHDHKAN
jgi:peptidoglycan-associated lipoprotein